MHCDRCNKRDATIHWTEYIEGAVLERHLCEGCKADELPNDLPSYGDLRFYCRCGKSVHWCVPRDSCAHDPSDYEHAGEMEVEIDTCECGMKFVAVTPRWRCRLCGAEAATQPRKSGFHGYLRDHIYGSPEPVEIQIRGMMP